MKFNIFFSSLLLLSIFVLASCGEDKFSQVVEIDLPEHEPVLSVAAEFSNVDTQLQVVVGRTWPTIDRPENASVENATIKLYKNGSLFKVIENDTNFFDGFYDVDLGADGPLAPDGAVYRLEVAAPGFDTVFAEQKMPSLVEITKGTYEPQGIVSPEGDKVDEITIEFDDPAGVGDYYGVGGYYLYTEVFGEDTFTYNYSLYLETFDPLLESGANNLLLVGDKSFDGKKVTLKTYCYCGFDSNQENYEIVLHLVHLTREKYLYLRSLSQFWDTDGNPFAEPVTVQGNIQGGVGLFSLETLDILRFKP